MRKRWKGVGLAALAMLALGNVAYAANEPKVGVVQKNDVNIRSEASVDSKVLGTLNEKSNVTIVGSKNNFYEITWEGKTAYVAGNLVAVAEKKSGSINAKNVVLRSEASIDSKKLATLNKNDTVSILGESKEFYQIETRTGSGFVAKEFVEVQKAAPESTERMEPVAPVTENATMNVVQTETAPTTSPVAAPVSTAAPSAIEIPEAQAAPVAALSTEDPEAILMLIEEEEDLGLSPEVTDPKTAEYQVQPGNYSEEELDLIARLIQAEGAYSNDSLEAVASVVYNRLVSGKFPSTVEEVVFQKSQFTVTKNRDKFNSLQPSQAAKDAVQKVFVQGIVTLPPDIMYFKSSRLSKSWGSRVYYKTIDGNMFYS